MDIGHHADSARFLIRDRAGQFTKPFDAVFTAAGIRVLPSPLQAPKANTICERMGRHPLGPRPTAHPRRARPGDPATAELLRDRATADQDENVRGEAVYALAAGWPGAPATA